MKRFAASFVALAAALAAVSASAQSFPDRPITIINPYAAGGPADLLAHTVAEGMSKVLGQPVVVDNKTGGGTAIGAGFVARSKPDGYTLFIGGSPSHIVTPALVSGANYDGIKDFAPVGTVAIVPNVLVVPADRPWKTVKELVEAAKAAPADKPLTFASVGVGSLPQFLGVLLQQRAGVKLTHVSYGGAAPAVTDLLGGTVDMAFLNVPPVLAHVRGGKLRALGVANNRRAGPLPDVPTMAEAGFQNFEMSTWYGISAPAGTPKEVIDKLWGAIEQSLKQPENAEKLTSRGAELYLKNPQDYAALLTADSKVMLELIAVAGMKAN